MINCVFERHLRIVPPVGSPSMFDDLRLAIHSELDASEKPVRFAVTRSSDSFWECEAGIYSGSESFEPIFHFNKRAFREESSFNVVFVVPTGVGAEVGGHAGDATPASTLLASICDRLITHPNVFNASDIIQIPPNAWYVEGSLLARLLMGTIGLRPVRSNRLLVLIQDHEDEMFTNAAINSVNAARSSYGLSAQICLVDREFRMVSAYSDQGAASGQIYGLERVFDILDRHAGTFDAVAITSVIELSQELHQRYYEEAGDIVNPWGGVEAMLTHAITLGYGVPAAHSPMLESREIADMDFGVVDPRMAAEVVSIAFLQCILRGLQHSPAVVPIDVHKKGIGLGAADVSCLVLPDRCIGLPTLAALWQGIPVVAVADKTNRMENRLTSLPWREGQFYQVANYLEAAGVVASLRAGLDPNTTKRPVTSAMIRRQLKRLAGRYVNDF